MADPLPALDRERGISACAGSTDLHSQVAGMLAAEILGRVAELNAALAGGDLTAAGRLGHKHKGACLAVGAIALADAFARVDSAARTGDGLTAAEHAAVLPAMAEDFRKAVKALQ